MIVLTLPRCGATKYCLDMAEKTGLPFVGEMTPNFITDFNPYLAEMKKEFHETHHDSSISVDDFINVIENPDNYIIQVNDAQHFLLPKADVFLLRKDVNNIMFSFANLVAKAYKTPDAMNYIMPWINSLLNPTRLIYTYVHKKNITPVWYEDYFDNYPCSTPELDSLPDSEQFKDVIRSFNLNALSQQILER